MKLPSHLKKYFWDTDFAKLDHRRHRVYILERILDLGDEPSVIWMNKTYPLPEIQAVVQKSRKLSPRSANFWKLVFGSQGR